MINLAKALVFCTLNSTIIANGAFAQDVPATSSLTDHHAVVDIFREGNMWVMTHMSIENLWSQGDIAVMTGE